MPALDEGSFLLMPVSMPHAGIEENLEVLDESEEEVIVEEEKELTHEEYLDVTLRKAKDAARPLSVMIAMKKMLDPKNILM